MGIWTNFDGKITTHIDDHFSLKKAFKEFFDGDEANIFCTSWVHNDKLVTDFDINIEDEIVVATKDFKMFLEYHKKQNKHFEADANVEGRILC